MDELKALENTLARSLESGVLLLDAEGTVLALNEIGVGLLGIEESRVGEPVSTVLGGHTDLAAVLDRAIRREHPVQRVECTIETPEGSRTLGVTAHPLRRDDAALRGFLVIFADLTEVQKETEQRQLADSLSQLGELTAGVAHEMRNSLATLRGYLALVERDPERESLGDYLGEIRHESDHLKRVLEDFLMFARPGSVRPQAVDLQGLLYRAAADPALGEAAVRVETDDGAGAGRASAAFVVYGDPQLLERALRNVLSNAVRAPGRCRLRRAGASPARRGRLGSRSTDRGSRRGDLVRGSRTAVRSFFTQRAGGVGLGLALTRRIVLLHAGRIELENRPRGGARAILWLPRGKTVTESDNLLEVSAAPKSDGVDAKH